jgi:pimeloyl-ACP methyl ester carboxylesterase
MKKYFFFIFTIAMSNHANTQSTTNRPQTPKPPYAYNLDSVEYDNADKSVHLGATFTYPKTNGPFITLLMITGSGLQDRDETIFNHHPFAVIADYLTKKGYAVLRVDDRTMGKSTGDIKNATSADFANDVLTSFNYLLQRKEVNKNKIGLIGHSEGGIIAPLVYTKEPRVAFIISLAGTGIPGEKISLKQTEMAKKYLSDSVYHAYYILNQSTLHVMHDNAAEPDSVVLGRVKKMYEGWKHTHLTVLFRLCTWIW